MEDNVADSSSTDMATTHDQHKLLSDKLNSICVSRRECVIEKLVKINEKMDDHDESITQSLDSIGQQFDSIGQQFDSITTDISNILNNINKCIDLVS